MPGREGIRDQQLWRTLGSSKEKLVACLASNFICVLMEILHTEVRIFNIFQTYKKCKAKNQRNNN